MAFSPGHAGSSLQDEVWQPAERVIACSPGQVSAALGKVRPDETVKPAERVIACSPGQVSAALGKVRPDETVKPAERATGRRSSTGIQRCRPLRGLVELRPPFLAPQVF
jgi:hypothetical protein